MTQPSIYCLFGFVEFYRAPLYEFSKNEFYDPTELHRLFGMVEFIGHPCLLALFSCSLLCRGRIRDTTPADKTNAIGLFISLLNLWLEIIRSRNLADVKMPWSCISI